jgi:hypothetical protein
LFDVGADVASTTGMKDNNLGDDETLLSSQFKLKLDTIKATARKHWNNRHSEETKQAGKKRQMSSCVLGRDLFACDRDKIAKKSWLK